MIHAEAVSVAIFFNFGDSLLEFCCEDDIFDALIIRLPRKQHQHECSSKANRQLVNRNRTSSSRTPTFKSLYPTLPLEMEVSSTITGYSVGLASTRLITTSSGTQTVTGQCMIVDTPNTMPLCHDFFVCHRTDVKFKEGQAFCNITLYVSLPGGKGQTLGREGRNREVMSAGCRGDRLYALHSQKTSENGLFTIKSSWPMIGWWPTNTRAELHLLPTPSRASEGNIFKTFRKSGYYDVGLALLNRLVRLKEA
ncbi:unnamed protein product [Protopolystoma xenopodis]|uniref:Uncharacterized protein n=1 Tax=Protopolystoma xenopodis TaxID=117903 RepID=A0A3S5BAG0_9PLAT|nr:unnamed protein product [Protopolystoma xenopodis]